MEFALEAQDMSTIIFSAAFEPNLKYKITVKATNNVLDGFGQPLQSTSSTFRTEALPSFFANPSASLVVFPTSSVESGVLQTWPVVTHGKGIVEDKSKRPADMHCTPITESNLARIMALYMSVHMDINSSLL